MKIQNGLKDLNLRPEARKYIEGNKPLHYETVLTFWDSDGKRNKLKTNKMKKFLHKKY